MLPEAGFGGIVAAVGRRRIAPLRRRAIATGLLGIAILASGCRAEAPPFVLLLTADTLRADRLGAYDSPLGLTPHLDALLGESAVFRTAYAPCSYTLPSLSALMTGRYPEEVGLFTNASRMGAAFATLPAVLALHGWRTGAVVSNYVLREGTGFEQGFDLYDASFPQREANRDMPERIAGDTTDAGLEAIDALHEEGAAPTFLWVHYQDPHGPYTPPPGRRERYLDAERQAPGGQRSLETRRGHRGIGSIPDYQVVDGQTEIAFYRAGYDGEVSYLDDEIGRLLAGLDARGLLKDAIVVFTADHGEGLGEHDYWFAHGEYLYDSVVRVPLAIRVPGRPPETRTDPASLLDILPSVLALVGIEPPAESPGRDLLAAGAPEARPDLYLAGLRHATVPRFGLVSEHYKYLVSEEKEGRVESLYRLGDETRDLGGEEPAKLAELRDRLTRFRAALRVAPESRQQLGPAERERLRQLGYVIE